MNDFYRIMTSVIDKSCKPFLLLSSVNLVLFYQSQLIIINYGIILHDLTQSATDPDKCTSKNKVFPIIIIVCQ